MRDEETDGAANGIINGSLIVFGLMFTAALVVGRLYCGSARRTARAPTATAATAITR
jgi:hypothetical protein